MLHNSLMWIVSLKPWGTHEWQSKWVFNCNLIFWLCPAVLLLSHSEERYSQGFCSAAFTHPSQIFWTGSSNFTQVQVLPAGNVKITCNFKAKLMCLQTVVLQHPNSLIKAGLRNAEIQHQKVSKLKGVAGGTCKAPVRELHQGFKTTSISWSR